MATVIHLLTFFFILTTVSAQQKNVNVTLGSSLSPNNSPSSWVSSSGDFAFGFYPQGKDHFIVAIWFARIPEKTVIWAYSTHEPHFVSNTLVQMTMDGRLILRPAQGVDISISNATGPASCASMLNSGNFVLYNSDSDIIWQSFSSPTDSIIQGQNLPTGYELYSSVSRTDSTRGRFRLSMQADGELIQYPAENSKENHTYWTSGTKNTGNSIITLNLQASGYLYLFNNYYGLPIKDLSAAANTSDDTTFYRMTIDWDGIFRLYSLGRVGNWSIKWSSSLNKCDPLGLCGENSYCTILDEEVKCICLPGFNFQNSSQPMLGCGKNISVDSCEEFENVMYRQENTVWEDNYYSILSSTDIVDIEDCTNLCLVDCSCAAAISTDLQCKLLSLPMTYGRRVTRNVPTVLIRVTGRKLYSKEKSTNLGRRNAIVVGCVFGFCIILTTILCASFRNKFSSANTVLFWKRSKKDQKVEEFIRNNESVAPKRYNYSDVKRITSSFKDKLGEGGFGSVFKGTLLDGRLVAVKVMKQSKDDGEDFINEVASISRTSHINIVSLLGFCFDGSRRALIYEFMHNGSLEKFIYKDKPLDPISRLPWETLYQILVGVSRGLEYLHRGCNTRILHFDIKPHNILLDNDFCPKISDFGLAKLCSNKESYVSMLDARGTVGYIAPEVFCRNFGGVSHKSDVYSFGMMVLEIVGGRKNVNGLADRTSEIFFPQWIYTRIELKSDLGLHGITSIRDTEITKKMILVGLWCIQTNPSDRPSMSKVVEMFEGRMETLQIPPKAFLPNTGSSNDFPIIVGSQST